jgi:hypothetical protein
MWWCMGEFFRVAASLFVRTYAKVHTAHVL